MRKWAAGYVATVLPVVVASFALPRYHLLLWGLLGWSAPTAVVVGVIKNRPSRRLPWLLVAVALAAFVTGDMAYDVLTEVLHHRRPFPSVADGFYLVTYPLVAWGLLGLMRGRDRERNVGLLLDALIVTALAAPPWIYLIRPYVRAADLTLFERVVSISYPLGDLVIVCVLARLVLSRGLRNWSVRLLTSGALGLLVADIFYGAIQLEGHWRVGGPTDLGWVLLYVCWGAAALHPSMRDLTEIQPEPRKHLSMTALVALGATTLVAPGLLVWRAATGGVGGDVGAIGVASAVVFLLVMARLTSLARTQAAQADRERVLRTIGERLVGASELETVDQTAVAAVESLIGSDVVACFVTVTEGGLERVVAAQPAALTGALFEPDEAGLEDNSLPPQLTGGDLVPGVTRATHWSSFTFGGTNSDERRVVIGHQGSRPFGSAAVGNALAAQLTLAADRVQLAEDLHQRKSEARFSSIIRNASDVILVVQANHDIRSETPSLGAVLGYEGDAATTLRLSMLVHPDDRPLATSSIEAMLAGSHPGPMLGNWQIRHADGRWLDMEVVANNLSEDAAVAGVVLTMRDVSDRKMLEEELRRQAFHDSLTNLANRVLFYDRVEHALSHRSRLGTDVSVLLLDIDDFKSVNDTLGHAAGDQLLVQFAERLTGCLRGEDTAARLGGDEFAVCIEVAASQPEGAASAQRILEAMARPFTVSGTDVTAHVSIGITIAGDSTKGSIELMHEADLALYAAKNAGKGSFHFYEDGLHHAVLARLERRGDLEEAIRDDQLLVHYQPIVNLENATMVGVEALVRWDHPTLGLLPPSEFTPVAEDSGLIVPLGRWVLDRACSDLSRWQRRGNATGARPFYLSVNVSARQLQSPDFMSDVADTLRRHDVDPRWLTFEISETLLVQDSADVLSRLRAVHDIGIAIAVNDFGTGYSSLSQLHNYPIQALKIDRSLVTGIHGSDLLGDQVTVIRVIIAIANTLGLTLVAEGIEEDSERRQLRALGCTYGQGFHLGRPVTAESMDELIDQATDRPGGDRRTALSTAAAPPSHRPSA